MFNISDAKLILWLSHFAESEGIRQRQKPQAPMPQAPVRNRQTRKVANAKVRIG